MTPSFMNIGSINWEIPQWLFNYLNDGYNFTLDAAANEWNYKVDNWLGYESLNTDWNQKAGNGVIYLNPPVHQSETRRFVRKAYNTSLNGNTVVCILPAKTGNSWFHDFCIKADTIIFLQGRLKSKGQTAYHKKKRNNLSFDTMIVIFYSKEKEQMTKTPEFIFWSKQFLNKIEEEWK